MSNIIEQHEQAIEDDLTFAQREEALLLRIEQLEKANAGFVEASDALFEQIFNLQDEVDEVMDIAGIYQKSLSIVIRAIINSDGKIKRERCERVERGH